MPAASIRGVLTYFGFVVVLIYWEKTQKAKVQLELKLASIVSDNKKGFLKYINSKKRSKENTGSILVKDGHLIGMKKKQEHSMLFLLQSLIILMSDWAAQDLSQRTTTVGTVPFHLWTLKL